MKTYLLLLLLTVSFNLFSQSNMVKNSDFEEPTKCPQIYTQWNGYMRGIAPDWSYPTKGTPDFFHTCSDGTVGVPANFAGYAQPHSGKAYVGLIAKGSHAEYREYLQTELLYPMEAEKLYCVQFYWQLSTHSKYAVQQLGVYFGKATLRTYYEDAIKDREPQVVNQTQNYLDNKKQWVEFCGIYKAQGGEKVLLLGNFLSDSLTNFIQADIKGIKERRLKDYAYYFIDDVSVHAMSDCYVCSCSNQNRIEAELVPKHVRKVGGNDGAIDLKIIEGLEPLTIKWSNGLTDANISQLTAGTYTLTITDANGCNKEFSVEIEQPDSIFMTIEPGVPKILKNVLFYFDETIFLPSSYKELNDLLAYMEDNPNINIKLLGHTDNKGTDEYNIELSNNRAKAVVEYLTQHGIDAKRLSWEGFGETKPITTNDTDQNRQLNRRVEFMVLE